jgi:hypothetical protein
VQLLRVDLCEISAWQQHPPILSLSSRCAARAWQHTAAQPQAAPTRDQLFLTALPARTNECSAQSTTIPIFRKGRRRRRVLFEVTAEPPSDPPNPVRFEACPGRLAADQHSRLVATRFHHCPDRLLVCESLQKPRGSETARTLLRSGSPSTRHPPRGAAGRRRALVVNPQRLNALRTEVSPRLPADAAGQPVDSSRLRTTCGFQ